MDLEGIMLHEVNQTAKDREKPYDFTFMWNLKNNNKKIKSSRTETDSQRTNWWLPGGKGAGD